MTQKVIVYRNQTEERIDTFLYQENGFIILGGVIVATFIVGLLYGKLREWYRWRSFRITRRR